MSARAHGSLRGQAIVEYLVIVTAIVLSYMGVRNAMRKTTNGLYNAASDQVTQAATGYGQAQFTGGNVWQ